MANFLNGILNTVRDAALPPEERQRRKEYTQFTELVKLAALVSSIASLALLVTSHSPILSLCALVWIAFSYDCGRIADNCQKIVQNASAELRVAFSPDKDFCYFVTNKTLFARPIVRLYFGG